MQAITIIDESTAGGKRAWSLDVDDILTEIILLREVIRRRIYQEVTEYNARQAGAYQGLVQPVDAERTLNGYHLKAPRQLDWAAQYEQAIEAFARRGYIMLVNDRQVADLDTPIELRSGTEVTFLKLVPLVGG
jgi:hypothetical protein